MPKTFKFILSGIIAIAIGYISYLIINFILFTYHTDCGNREHYLWAFKDSVKKDIDTLVFHRAVRDRDVIYSYFYKNKYHVVIWEFKDLDGAQLKTTPINLNQNLNNIKLFPGEIHNSGYSPETTIKYGRFFYSSMEINIDDSSVIDTTFETLKYKGFYGNIHKASYVLS